MTIQRRATPRTLLCLLLLTLTPLVLADCYYRNNTLITGDEANNYQECDSGACCYKDETCLPNKLCVKSAMFSRQACQIKQWPQANCSQLCLDEDGGTSLTPCDDGRVCCGEVNTDCCDAGGGVLINFYGDIVAPITVTTVSTATTILEPLTLTGTQMPRTWADVTADAVGTSEDTSSSSDHSTPMTPAMKGGIAAGVVAVVLALVVVAWVFVRERNRKREGAPTDRDLQRAAFSASERAVDYKGGYAPSPAGYASPAVSSGLRELPRGYMRPEPRDTKRFELDGRGFGSEEAVGGRKF